MYKAVRVLLFFAVIAFFVGCSKHQEQSQSVRTAQFNALYDSLRVEPGSVDLDFIKSHALFLFLEGDTVAARKVAAAHKFIIFAQEAAKQMSKHLDEENEMLRDVKEYLQK